MEKTCNTCTSFYCKGKGTYCASIDRYIGDPYSTGRCDWYSANYNIGAEINNDTWWSNLLRDN